MSQVDLSTIPLNSIERIEITRGNSGAVLYGDNAVGGVINIVTKTGVGGPPVAIRGEAGVGSFNQRLANVSAATNYGPWSASFYGNAIKSDGYRVNNALDQRNGVGNINYTTPDLKAFLTVTGDDQKLGFPGGRFVDPSIGLDELATNRRGTDTPFDYGNQQGKSATAGFTKTIIEGVDLIVDGGVRNKKSQGGFFVTDPLPSFSSTYVDADLTTWSITPRLSVKNTIFGIPSQILTGIDYYDATFDQSRGAFKGLAPDHIYNLSQQTLAGYWQQTRRPVADDRLRLRRQDSKYTPECPGSERPHMRPAASVFQLRRPGLAVGQQRDELCIAYRPRASLQQRVLGVRPRRARVPHAQRRRAGGVGPGVRCVLQSDPRRLQAEDPDLARHRRRLPHQVGRIPDAIEHLQHGPRERDPFHPGAVLQRQPRSHPPLWLGDQRLAARQRQPAAARRRRLYPRDLPRRPFAGNDVPLVSRYTAMGGVTWNIWQNYLVLDATLRAWSERFMDNDQRNIQRRIPADATVDLKLSGAYEHFFWSVGVNNLLDALYYDYAIASTFTPGRFSAYPLPGRSYMVKAGATF